MKDIFINYGITLRAAGSRPYTGILSVEFSAFISANISWENSKKPPFLLKEC